MDHLAQSPSVKISKMANENTLLFVMLLFLVQGSCSALSPGVQLRLTQKGLDYAAVKAVDNLNLQGQHIDDQHGKDHEAGGKVEYDITGTVVQSFGKPSSSVVVSPGKGITWTARGASASLHGDWRYKYRWHFVKVSDHGSFDVSASGVDFSVSFALGRDSSGHPTIKSTGCSASVGRLKVKFHHGASWLYNLFDKAIARNLKGKLSDLMCKSVNKLIDIDARRKLTQLKLVTDVGRHHEMTLDYSLTHPPAFNKGYMDVMLKGEFFWKSAPKNPPFNPGPFPEESDSSKMLYIWGSEYVMNSYIYAAYEHQRVRANITKENLKGDGDFLNTTCPGFTSGCIGNFLYKVSVMYPHSSVKVNMGASEVPYFRITPEGINFHGNGTMSFYAHTSKGKEVYLFKIQAVVDMKVKAWVNGTTLKGKIDSIKPDIRVLDSKVGKLTDKFMNWVFKMIANKFLIKAINKLGEKGMIIPNIKDCKYVNPVLKLNTGNLLISTDLNWSPSKRFRL